MSLDALFAPRTVAVLGVSRNPAKLGHRLLQNVKEGGFAGTILPVNPSGEPVLGLPTVTAVDALPDGVDLALVSLPAAAVPSAIERLAARRVRAAVVLSSGFGEVDDEGRGTEARLLATARAAGLRLVGPNCMGVYSAPARLNGTYFWDLPDARGGIAVVSQSGAYGGLIFRHLGTRGLGVARFLSIGNQADVDIAEVIEYLADDDATTLIACFVEALRDGAQFVRAAGRATARKPVVVLKGGRSDAGRRAAGSHTGSLAGTYEVYRAGFRRAGVVLAEETEEFFDAIETLVVAGTRRPRTPRIAIVTVSGGPSVVAADCAERSGLTVPALAAATGARLRDILPSFAAVGNPVDLTPQVEPSRIRDAVRIVVGDSAVDGVVAVNVGLDIPEFADSLVAEMHATGKPVVAFTADAPRVGESFRRGGVPVLPSPERAVRAMRSLWLAGRSARRTPSRGPQRGPSHLADARSRPGERGTALDDAIRSRAPSCASGGGASIELPAARSDRGLPLDVRGALDTTIGPLPYELARALLELAGVRFCAERHATTVDDAVGAADALGYPVVVKADAPGLTHKTEAGAVRLDVRSAGEVRAACGDFRARLGAVTFVVQQRVARGVELLVGARRDEVFGPVVMLGAGGGLTEVIGDVSLRLAPLADDEAEEMLREGLRPRLLAGPRGLPPVEPRTLLHLLSAVADLMVREPRIMEIDVNPVITAGDDAIAVDALVIVGEPGTREGGS